MLPETVGVIKPYHVSVGKDSTVNVCGEEPVVVVDIFVPAPELFHAVRESVIIDNHGELVVVDPTKRIEMVRDDAT